MTSHMPAWFQLISMVVLFAVLAFDLLLIVKRPHTPSMREASLWVVAYVVAALVFAVCVWAVGDSSPALEFLAGWLTEYSLSLDNLFVFVLIIANFRVPQAYQQRALMIGIVLALIFRGIFIVLGAALIDRFVWVFFIFGAWLIWTAWQQATARPTAEHPEELWTVRLLGRVLPLTEQFDGGKLRTVVAGQRRWTPFLLALIALGSTDLLFALDSIPAIFGITQDAFIVFTANLFALMGLRQLYFLLGALLDRLEYLQYGIAAILAFIGVKLILHALHENKIPFIYAGKPVPVPEIDTWFSLAMIVCAMSVATAASLVKVRRRARQDS